MAYTLQAIIAKRGVLNRHPLEGANLVSLKQGYEMLPFTDSFIKKHQIPFLPLTDEGVEQLPESINKLCAALSKEQQLAYVEAEFFGGAGTQACVVFENGETKLGPKVNESAINEALSVLGAEKTTHYDEFEAIGLDVHRDTNEWVK